MDLGRVTKRVGQTLKGLLGKNVVKQLSENPVLVLALVVLAYVLYTKWNASRGEGFADPERAVLVLYHLPGCPHCVNMMPEWEKVVDAHEADDKVNIKTVNCQDEPGKAKEVDVESFPTIILFKDGKKVVYESGRTQEELEEFLNSN